MSRRSLLLLLVISLVLTACGERQSPPQAGRPANTAAAETPGSTDSFDIWYSTRKAESPAQIRKGADNQPVMAGEDFALSDDFSRLAVMTGKTLELTDLAGKARTVVAENVEKFRWRPGTQELLYLVREAQAPRTARWFLRRADGTVLPVAEAPFANLLPAQVSPDGTWLAYFYLRSLTVISLKDQTVHTLTLQDEESSGAAVWAGPEFLSVNHGARVVLVQVPSGERRTFADVGATVSAQAWTRDGKKVALLTRQVTQVYREGSLVGTCQAGLAPSHWSPDGRFLALSSLADGSLHLLDTRGELDSCKAVAFAGMETVEAWHPASTKAVLTSRTDRVEAAELQVWDLAGQKPVLLRTLGRGATAHWVCTNCP